MTENRVGNLFEQEDISVIVHQANLYHTMSAGVAKIIKQLYPEAYEADCKTQEGDANKLGTYSVAKVPMDKLGFSHRYIINLYSQIGIGGDERNTRYDALYDGLAKIAKKLDNTNFVLGIPYGIGCGLGGGNWNIVKTIIDEAFKNSSVKVVICRLPSQPEF